MKTDSGYKTELKHATECVLILDTFQLLTQICALVVKIVGWSYMECNAHLSLNVKKAIART